MEKENNRILITGATGFIGRRLVDKFIQQGDYSLFALIHPDEFSPDTRHSLTPNVTALAADLRDLAQVRDVVGTVRPHVIYHLAAAGVRQPFLDIDEALAHNLSGTIHIARAAFEIEDKPSSVRQLIVARSSGERSAMNHYAASKAAAWQICCMYARTRSWPIVGGMIFQAYGPRQSVENLIPAAVQAALSGQDFPMTSGKQRRDWVYIDDVIACLAGMAAVSFAPGTTLEIGSGRLTSVSDVVRLIYQMTGKKGRPLLGDLQSRPGEDLNQRADVAQTERLSGWQAKISLQEGLKKVIEAYQVEQQN